MNQNYRMYCILALSCACLAFGLSSCKKNAVTSVNNSTAGIPSGATLPSNAPLKGVKVAIQKRITVEPREIKINSEKIGSACRTHSDCEAGQACIQKVCKSMDYLTCSTDLDCPDYEKCFDGKCAMCASDSDCSTGYICSYSGVCLPNQMNLIECTQASECDAGEVCVNGKCSGFCSEYRECESQLLPYATARCERSTSILTGICADSRACHTNDDCHSGYECYMKRCERIICKTDEDCGEGYACHDGFCYAHRCTKDSDCSSYEVCRQNECKIQCENDDSCGHGSKCIDSACQYECSAEKCKESGNGNACIHNQCQVCAADADCGEGKYCLIQESIDLNDTKSKNESQRMSFYQPVNIFYNKNITTQCVECLTDEHCSDGLHCMNHQCKSYECNEDKDCGEGKFCHSSHQCKSLGKTCKASSQTPENDGTIEIDVQLELGNNGVNVEVNHGEESSEECNSNQVCADGICLSKSWQPECKIDSDCRALSERAVCNPVPTLTMSEGYKQNFKFFCAIACSNDDECKPFANRIGGACVNGICASGNARAYCNTNADCKDGKVCSLLYGECIDDPAKRLERNVMLSEAAQPMSMGAGIDNYLNRAATVSCWRDSDCNDTSCTGAGICGCVDDIQCGNGKACKVNGCVCIADEGCPQGFSCKNEICLCNSDEACGSGMLCSEEQVCIKDIHPVENYLRGQKYEKGQNGSDDIQKAVKVYQTALDNGSLGAMLALGRLYYDGNGVQKDETLGKKLIHTAITIYENRDTDISKDAPKILEKFIQSEDKTFWGADKEIAMLYLEGKYIPQNEEKAISMLGNGFEEKYTLAQFYESKGDFEKARYYYEECSRYGVEPKSKLFKMRVNVSHRLIDMAEKNLGVSKELCENDSEPNLKTVCSEYKYLGEYAKDAKFAYEYAAMCREYICSGCFGDDDKLFDFALEAGIVSQDCKDDQSLCPPSQWKQNKKRDHICFDLLSGMEDEEEEEML